MDHIVNLSNVNKSHYAVWLGPCAVIDPILVSSLTIAMMLYHTSPVKHKALMYHANYDASPKCILSSGYY